MAAYRTKGAPFTYVIDYEDHLNRITQSLAKLKDGTPQLFHGSHDFAYPTRSGASDFHSWKTSFTKARPAPWSEPIGPAEAKKRTATTRRWTNAVHEAGVESVIPYICNQTIGGDPDARTGFWWFYDRWDEYADDVGPKPSVDPIDWMQREPDGRLHFNYPYRFFRTDPPLRFAPCPNSPHWHGWLMRVIKRLAQDGFDGVFVDNNIIHCRCEHCQAEFRRYLAETYSPAQRRRRFGTDDVAKLSLATKGDVILWASALPEYREHLLRDDRKEFVEKFGTDDPNKAIMSEGGNGFHWGRAYRFWLSWLHEHHDGKSVEHALRVGDLSSRGVRTSVERCLWADTQKFWAWTVGRRNAELRAAAESVRPGFRMVPNWGDISGFIHTVSRSLEGKNIRLWAPGTDLAFFEEEYFPGTIAPGYTFDLMIAYKYAGACGVRACALPYRGSERRSLVELAMAEAAAWGGDGALVQPGYAFPELRETYRSFFESHEEWFEGRTSVADVGLVYSFDEIHMGNRHHLREVYGLARYLADHHILFDFLNEKQLVRREFARFRLVIVPHVQFLPTRSRKELLRYIASGGSVLFTGNTGGFDEHGRPCRSRDALERMRPLVWGRMPFSWTEHHGVGALAWLNDVRTWLPKRQHELIDLADTKQEELRTIIPTLKPPVDDGRLADLLDRLANKRLSVLAGNASPTLRASAWSRGNESIVLHLINYDAPGPETEKEGPPAAARDVSIRLSVPNEMRVESVVAATAAEPRGQRLSFTRRDGHVRFVVPRIDCHTVVRIG